MRRWAKAAVVPVRPIPALQWMIAFSEGEEFRSMEIKEFNIIEKSSIEVPEGTP